MKKIALFFLLFLPLYGAIENSIIPEMNALSIQNLNGKVNETQMKEMEDALHFLDQKVRVISFNMLTDTPSPCQKLDKENEWPNRRERIVAYLKEANPDIIGTQELNENMLDYLLDQLGEEYGCFGEEMDHDCQKGEIPAIFYKKERLQLLNGRSVPFKDKNGFTVCLFKDLLTQKEFAVYNTHLSFFDVEKRLKEAQQLTEHVHSRLDQIPSIVTGDFNTFPFRPSLDLPFYDGNFILDTLLSDCLLDSLESSLFGHFGALGSTNYSTEKKGTFSSNGEPGVILDHIFVSYHMSVVSAGIDPAKVDGFFPSDHFPVIADIIYNYPTILPAMP